MKKRQFSGPLSLAAAFFIGTSAGADPATFYIKSGDPAVHLDITFHSANSCYEGPTVTVPGHGAVAGQPVIWSALPNDRATFNVGRNSAVSGCTGELCVAFSPAQEGRQYQCFLIHGGGGVTPVAYRSDPLHPSMNYNDGTWDPATLTYTTRPLPLYIREIAEAETVFSRGHWRRICSPTGTCTFTSQKQIFVSEILAESMTEELETALATSISNTVTVGVETSTPVGSTSGSIGTTVSLTASIRKAVATTLSRSTEVGTSAEETLSCTYTMPQGRFGYIYETSVTVGGETMVHRTCDHACGDENEPTFAQGSPEHLASCRE